MATGIPRPKKKSTPSQARAARRARRQSRRRLLRYGAVLIVGLIAIIFIVALFLPGLPFGRARAGPAPTGPGVRLAEQGRTPDRRSIEHIVPGEAHPAYNSTPATSGWHYAQPLAPARWGIHQEVLTDEVLLHNLEHGGIGIHYNCPEACPDLVAQLTAIMEGQDKVIMSPYPGMPTRIALTAWTFLDQFDEFDEGRIRAFIEAHESSPNAPEPLAR